MFLKTLIANLRVVHVQSAENSLMFPRGTCTICRQLYNVPKNVLEEVLKLYISTKTVFALKKMKIESIDYFMKLHLHLISTFFDFLLPFLLNYDIILRKKSYCVS